MARDPQLINGNAGLSDEKPSLSVITSDLQILRACLHHSGAHALVRDHDGFKSVVNLLTVSNDSQDFLEALELALGVLCLLLQGETT